VEHSFVEGYQNQHFFFTFAIINIFMLELFFSRNEALKGRKIAEFREKDSKVRVLLLNLNNHASGLNIIEATHIILMGNPPSPLLLSPPLPPFPLFLTALFYAEPVQGDQGKATEDQAIGRAHRQGQTERVTVVR
jgi:hypothetical protein